MAASFLVDDILQRQREESPTGNMLYNFFNFLKLFEGRSRMLDPSQIKRHLSSC